MESLFSVETLRVVGDYDTEVMSKQSSFYTWRRMSDLAPLSCFIVIRYIITSIKAPLVYEQSVLPRLEYKPYTLVVVLNLKCFWYSCNIEVSDRYLIARPLLPD